MYETSVTAIVLVFSCLSVVMWQGGAARPVAHRHADGIRKPRHTAMLLRVERSGKGLLTDLPFLHGLTACTLPDRSANDATHTDKPVTHSYTRSYTALTAKEGGSGVTILLGTYAGFVLVYRTPDSPSLSASPAHLSAWPELPVLAEASHTDVPVPHATVVPPTTVELSSANAKGSNQPALAPAAWSAVIEGTSTPPPAALLSPSDSTQRSITPLGSEMDFRPLQRQESVLSTIWSDPPHFALVGSMAFGEPVYCMRRESLLTGPIVVCTNHGVHLLKVSPRASNLTSAP